MDTKRSVNMNDIFWSFWLWISSTARRMKSEYASLLFVGTRRHAPSRSRIPRGVRHSVEVEAQTLYEAAVLALRSFREHDCTRRPILHGSKEPAVPHTLLVHAIDDWLNRGARSPKEAIEQRRLWPRAVRAVEFRRIGATGHEAGWKVYSSLRNLDQLRPHSSPMSMGLIEGAFSADQGSVKKMRPIFSRTLGSDLRHP
jgi:hypothetical protein